MSKTIEQINQELDANIPREAVQTRDGGRGMQLSYLAGHYVIDRLNKVFGPLNWASKTERLEVTFSGTIKDRFDKDLFYTSYIAQVRLVVEGPDGKRTEHTCTGFGDGQDKSNPGKTHELAAKEAETDALKRAAKNLGMSMGLALYDKDQTNVGDEQEEEPKKSTEKAAANKEEKKSATAAEKSKTANAPVANSDPANTLRLITATSKVVVAQGKRTVEQLKAEMKAKHGTDNKEKLSAEAAAAFLAHLTELSNKVTNATT